MLLRLLIFQRGSRQSPLLSSDSLSAVNSSRQTQRTRQDDNRADLFMTSASICAAMPLNDLLQKSPLTVYYRPPARTVTVGSCLRHWSYLFPSDIPSSLCRALRLQPVSWLPVHSLKSLNGTALLREDLKKNLIGTILRSGTRHKQA